MSTFTWTPDFGASKSNKINVVESQFGDGYSQRQQVGINPAIQIWNLNFSNRSQSEANQIDDFLISMGGVTAFDFTPPGASIPLRFICKSGDWTVQTVKYNLYTIQVKLTQVFEP